MRGLGQRKPWRRYVGMVFLRRIGEFLGISSKDAPCFVEGGGQRVVKILKFGGQLTWLITLDQA